MFKHFNNVNLYKIQIILSITNYNVCLCGDYYFTCTIADSKFSDPFKNIEYKISAKFVNCQLMKLASQTKMLERKEIYCMFTTVLCLLMCVCVCVCLYSK